MSIYLSLKGPNIYILPSPVQRNGEKILFNLHQTQASSCCLITALQRALGHNPRDDHPVLAKKPDPGLCTTKEGRFLKVFKANILDNFKSLLFCLHTFGVRRNIDVLDSENQPGSVQIRTGSGDQGLTGDV